ncbi:MAG: NTP transferase domain-containing protein [Nitrososphaerales archaeon]
MNLIALIMAGGKSSRMGGLNEKPLIKICGKSMLERVIEAVKGVKSVSKIVIAVSKYTPKTREEATRLSIEIIDTSGEDYVFDMQYAIKKLQAKYVLVLNSDLPFLNSALINEIITHYMECGKPTLMVAVPSKKLEELGFKTSLKITINGYEIAPVGINLLDGSQIDKGELEQEVMIINNVKPLLNINTIEDLELIKKICF